MPIEQLALAQSKGHAETNDFKLVVDAIDIDRTGDVAFGAAAVDFFARAPVVLVHGINDTQKNCWPDYANEIERAGFVADTDVDFSGLANKPGIDGTPPTFNGSVEDDVARIRTRLTTIAADYGTIDVHLVGHSKGGLDFVNFLWSNARPRTPWIGCVRAPPSAKRPTIAMRGAAQGNKAHTSDV